MNQGKPKGYFADSRYNCVHFLPVIIIVAVTSPTKIHSYTRHLLRLLVQTKLYCYNCNTNYRLRDFYLMDRLDSILDSLNVEKAYLNPTLKRDYVM